MEKDFKIGGLKNSVQALENSLVVYNEYSAKNAMLAEALRSGVIQNFEVAYELCWKFIQKWLELNVSPDIVKGVTKKEFYRIAKQHALIPDATVWWEFHNARNATSHIYEEDIAEDVFMAATRFMQHAKEFVATLENKI